MKQLFYRKTEISVLFLIIFSFAFFGFSDVYIPKYKMINDNVIKRDDGAMYIKGEIFIKFKNPLNNFDKYTLGVSRIDNFLFKYGVREVYQPHPLKANVSLRKIGDEEMAKIFLVKYIYSIDPSELSEKIYKDNKDIIDWVEPNYVYEADFIPNDPMVGSQWHIQKISSYTAWDITQGDTTMIIGMVDSGSDLDHPDLQANIKINYNENPTNNIDDDNNGYIDDWIGWDFAGADYQTLVQDNDPQIYGANCDHGSHTSGCASQVTNNATGGAGIGFKCKLLISKHGADNDYSGGGVSLLYNTHFGMTYVYQNGAKVMNCSFGGSTYSAYQQQIVNNAWANGCVVVASAGNQSSNTPRYPASYDNAVSVAATNSSDIKAWFSNWHTTVDISAPGEGIYSTLWNNTYTSYDGTSMSAPIVSGTIGLIRTKFPSYTPQQAVDKLLAGVDSIYHLNPSYQGMLGSGRVNAYKCVTGTSGVQANFSANVTSIQPGQSVNFTDLSTGGPTSWQWSFPGGNPSSSTQQNPSGITYNTIGSYDVSLTVNGPGGPNTLTKPNYINVSSGTTVVLQESFENATFPPSGWTKINPTGGAATGWNRQTTGTTPVPGFQGGYITAPVDGGSAVAFCNYITGNASGGTSGQCDQWLITPQISNTQPDDSLSFWLRKFGSYVENFWVRISTTTPTVAGMTTVVMSQSYTVSDSGWVQYKYRIGNLVPTGSNIYIGFREWVNNVAVDGASFSMDLVKVTRPTIGITNINTAPTEYELKQNYPNPFNPQTNIEYSLKKNGFVNLRVYDITGKEVAFLINEFQNAGNYQYVFNAGEYFLPSGVYFYKLISGEFTAVKKMIIVK